MPERGPIYEVELLDSLRRANAEIDRLQSLLTAATNLLRDRERMTWQWHARTNECGYYVDGDWVGVQVADAITAAAGAKES